MTDCNECANALWDRGDRSVGLEPCVDDCKVKSRSIELVFNDEIDECHFFIKQLTPEWELIKCPECNSRHSTIIGTTEYETEYRYMYQEGHECNDCGKIFTIDVF